MIDEEDEFVFDPQEAMELYYTDLYHEERQKQRDKIIREVTEAVEGRTIKELIVEEDYMMIILEGKKVIEINTGEFGRIEIKLK